MNTPFPHPVALESVVHYIQSPGKHPRPHRIPSSTEVVELVTGGRGWIQGDGQWREVLPGDLIWNSPGVETIGRSDFENPYRCLAVKFRVRRAKGTGIPRFSKWPAMEEINALAREACQLAWDESFDRNVLRDYLFSRLLFQVRLSERTARATRYSASLCAVLARIERDFASVLSLKDLAREADWSVPHLHSEFKKHLKTTPHRMLLEKRLRVAKERLASAWEPVKCIAVECGFADMPSFAHAFKMHTGQTPSEYRNYRR